MAYQDIPSHCRIKTSTAAITSNIAVRWLALLLHIQEVLYSVLGMETWYIDQDFHDFSHVNVRLTHWYMPKPSALSPFPYQLS